jgi:hypothetical protein
MAISVRDNAGIGKVLIRLEIERPRPNLRASLTALEELPSRSLLTRP